MYPKNDIFLFWYANNYFKKYTAVLNSNEQSISIPLVNLYRFVYIALEVHKTCYFWSPVWFSSLISDNQQFHQYQQNEQ